MIVAEEDGRRLGAEGSLRRMMVIEWQRWVLQGEHSQMQKSIKLFLLDAISS